MNRLIFKDLAFELLKKEGKPLHYKELTRRILKMKKSFGRTPEMTLISVMSKDPRFVRVGPGLYSLRHIEWAATLEKRVQK